MQKQKKKKWVRPKLVILTRNNPEQAILDGCKNINEISLTGPFGSRCSTTHYTQETTRCPNPTLCESGTCTVTYAGNLSHCETVCLCCANRVS